MNPLKEVAPWARIVTLIILGTAVIYGIGRWDQAISANEAQLAQQTRAILETAGAARSWRDSVSSFAVVLRERDAELALVERRHKAELGRLDSLARVEVATLARTPLDDLLPALRLSPIQLHPEQHSVVYATDSAGVRFLAGRMLRLAQLESRQAHTDSLAHTRDLRIRILSAAVDAAQLRGDRAEARILILEPLLERYLRVRQCRILWLVPCPSRTTSFVVGVIAGGVVVLTATR